MIDVEIKGRLGQYIKGFLINVIEDEAVVSYDRRVEEERVPLSKVRLPPSQTREVQPGHMAEVLFSFPNGQIGSQSGDLEGVLTGNWGNDIYSKSDTSLGAEECKHLELPAWWPCRVHKVRDEVAVVKLQVNPSSDADANDHSICTQLSNVTDIVNRNTLRHPNYEIPPISSATIHRHCIEIPKELSDFASDTTVHTEFLKHCGGPISVFYDADSSSLVVVSLDENTIRNVVLLEETHLKMLRQKWAITRSLRQTMRNIESNRGYDNGHGNLTSSRSSGDWETDPNLCYEKFYVPQRLMGLAIGAQGNNIRAAREIPGIVSVRLRETGDRRNGEPIADNIDLADVALFVVEAKTPEAAKQARAKLEFTELYLGVPRRYVGRLIGRRTTNILSIIRKSGVIQIHFDDNIKPPSDDESVPNMDSLNLNHSGPSAQLSTIRRVFLRAGGAQSTQQPHVDEEYGGFILSGTREAVEKARLLISFQLDYICDLEKMEAEKVALIRNLSHSSPDMGSGYPRGYGEGPSRWNDRGMGRGGRRPPRDAPFPPSAVPYGGPDSYSNQYEDDGSMPYGNRRRPPRDARGTRNYNGDSRPRRQSGRGLRRGLGASRGYADWNYSTGNNGDVADRRRGSEDSDALGSNLSHEMEASDQDPMNHYRRNRRTEKKRPEEVDTASSFATDEDNFPAGDESSAGENGPNSHNTPRARGSNRRGRVRSQYSGDRTRRDRAGRPPRNNRQWASNDETASADNGTAQLSTNNGTVGHVNITAA